jgi:hypothetical protein
MPNWHAEAAWPGNECNVVRLNVAAHYDSLDFRLIDRFLQAEACRVDPHTVQLNPILGVIGGGELHLMAG